MRYIRLKRRQDFGKVFRYGKTFGDRYVVLFVVFKEEGTGRRIGFAAQRQAGTAVRRNRIRRRLREAYGLMASRVTCDVDMVILGKGSVLEIPWDRLLGSLERVLKKAGCLMDKSGQKNSQ